MIFGESGGDTESRSSPRRILVVIGTRPEAIKMAPVVSALRERSPAVETRVLLTGQHTHLVDQVLDVFQLDPEWELGIMLEAQNLYDVAEGCLRGIRGVLAEWRPHLVLVQGDTATVFFASLAAFFEGVPVGHVEAGLRTDDKRLPFPEEMLRRLTGVVADLHFAPTERAKRNLLREGVAEERVWVTGNPVVDALLEISKRAGPARDPAVRELLAGRPGRLVLVTAHRRESFGGPLGRVFEAVRTLAERIDVTVVYPVHPNPRVSEPAHAVLGGHPRIHLTEPLAYLDLIRVMERASVILTDSGGIQEEAPTFGVPVLVLRDLTERPEGIEAGVAHLVGTDPERIVTTAERLLETGRETRGKGHRNPYGDGRAGRRIARIALEALAEGGALDERPPGASTWE